MTLGAETPRMAGERSVDVAAGSGTLHVALLGGFSIRVGSRVVPGSWRLRKSKTLVKLLALAGDHRAHRDVLAGVLWPGLDPAAAANNLHQALHAARRALASDRSPSADALPLRDDIVILWPDGDLIVDADVFAAAAQRALRSGSAEDYRAALKLYAGELLPEDRYADWAAPHRERLGALHEALTAGQARVLLRARALFATAVLEIRLGRPWRGLAIGAEIAALGRDLDDPGLMAEALHQQSLLAWMAGEWDDAARLAREAGNAARGLASVRTSHEHLRAVLALFRGETFAAQVLLDNALSALARVPPDAPPFFTVCTPAWSVDSSDDLLFPVFEETMLVGRRVGAAQSRGYILAAQAAAARMGGRFDEAGGDA